jgi:hypothetical protein
MHRLLRSSSILLAMAFFARGAHASTNYPMLIGAKVKAKTGMAIPAPPCTLCHAGTTGGTGTVVTDFGLAMQDFGARGKDPQSLENALDFAFGQDWDSDGDEVPDLEELASGKDPNDGPGRTNGIPRPQHGCSAARGPARQGGAAAVLGCGLAFFFARRRRSGSSRARTVERD